MESDDLTRDRAAADLAALQTDRTALADRARQPWWYDPALGLLIFLLIGSISLRSLWWTLGAGLVFALGLLGLKRAYERHTGAWVSGLRPGPTQRLVALWGVLYVVVLSAGLLLEFGLGVRGALVVAGAVVGVAAALISRRWTTVYQRDLRGGA